MSSVTKAPNTIIYSSLSRQIRRDDLGFSDVSSDGENTANNPANDSSLEEGQLPPSPPSAPVIRSEPDALSKIVTDLHISDDDFAETETAAAARAVAALEAIEPTTLEQGLKTPDFGPLEPV